MANIIDNTVYVVFRAYEDGDNYTTFTFLSVADSIQSATNIIQKDSFEMTHEVINYVHKSMSQNNEVYVGQRKDVNQYCNYNAFGGYVIEQRIVESN